MNNSIRIIPPAAFDAEVSVPGSKSLTNRAMICAALAAGRSDLEGVSRSEDSRVLIEALRRLGVKIEPRAGMALSIEGTGGKLAAEATLEMANAGTSLRFITAMVALGTGTYLISGDERMHERPIGALVEALKKLGAEIDYHGTPGCPPLHVHASGLKGGHLEVEAGDSSQFLSALLLAAPYAKGPVELKPAGTFSSKGYVDMTLQVMAAFGVKADGLNVKPGRYVPTKYAVEGDAAAAGYWFAMAAVTGGRVKVTGIGSACRQPEIGLLDDLAKMGAAVDRQAAFTEVRGAKLRGIDVDMNDRPDSVPALAVASIFAEGPTRIRNVAHLRHKESDRLAALSHELGKLGARVVEHRDGLEITPPAKPVAATIDTYRDHRMAMAFAIAGMKIEGVTIQDPGCVGKSYPNFWQALTKAGVGSTWG